jgi:hypothetical protein
MFWFNFSSVVIISVPHMMWHFHVIGIVVRLILKSFESEANASRIVMGKSEYDLNVQIGLKEVLRSRG